MREALELQRYACILLLAAACGPPPATPASPPAAGPPCIFHTQHWNDREPPRIALRAGARAFAEVYGDSKDVTLSIDANGAKIAMKSGLVRIRGFVAPGGIDLYPSRAFDVAGVMIPDDGHALDWRWSAAGQLSISVRAPHDVVATEELTTVRACGDLGIEPGAFDAFDALGGHGLARLAKLRPGRQVPLSLRPGGLPIAKVKLEADQDEAVIVVAEQDGAALVAWRYGMVLMHGWVPTTELTEGDQPLRLPMFVSMNADHFNWPKPLRVVSCARELELFGSQDGEQLQVGSILGGAVVGILDQGRPLSRVRVMDSGVLALEGASLLVKSKDLEACQPRP